MGSLVNINIKDVLIRLLSQKEFQLDEKKVSEIVDAVIDWIDEDDNVSPAGAESSYYASLAFPYSAKNAQLDCIEELLMIKGISSEIFAGTKEKPGLAQYVTVHGGGAINLNTAPKMVLRALSSEITATLADKMDDYRRKEENDLSSPLWYKKVPGMEGITIKAELITLVKSNYFKISATGKLDKMEQTVTGIVQRSPFQVMSWRQN
jgi:general secretion pathway protein K